MVVITGISGLLGVNLARVLLSQGRKVRGLIHHRKDGLECIGVELVAADICDPASLRRSFDGAEVVYHLAAKISLRTDCWQEVEAVNVLGTRNVVEACRECGVRRLVHISSIHALEQRPLELPLDEDRPLATSEVNWPYDRSKALGELEVRSAIEKGLDGIILYPTAIIGPYDYQPSYFGKALISLAEGRIPALVSGGFDWVDVRDVAAGAIAAEAVAPPGARYLLPGHWRSIRNLGESVAKLTGRQPPRITVPLNLAYRFAPVMGLFAHFNGVEPIYNQVSLSALRSNQQISSVRAVRDLDYQPRPFETTIADTFNWFVQNGYLEMSPPDQGSIHD